MLRKRPLVLSFTISCLCLAAGCEDTPKSTRSDQRVADMSVDSPITDGAPSDTSTPDGASDMSTPDGAGDQSTDSQSDAMADGGSTGLGLVSGVGLAVINSDYQSISLSLIDPATLAVSKDNCVNSGTQSPKLTTAFSGDVVLPSQPLTGNPLILIDRKNSTLTWINPGSCAVERQINVGTGFAANPQDVVIADGKLFISRYEKNPNPTPAANDYDEGSDVLIVDATSGQPVGRIDMTSQVTTTPKPTLPRPSRMVLAGGKIYVMLQNIGPNFAADEIGAARIVIIDPATQKVTDKIDFATLQNCGGLEAIETPAGLVASCNGNFGKTDGTQINGSGAVFHPLESASEPQTIVAASVFSRPASFSGAAVLDYDSALVPVPGEFSGTPADAVWFFDYRNKTAKKVFTASGGFVIGKLAIDRARKRAFVPHANAAKPRVQVIEMQTSGTPTVGSEINASTATGLPPREIAWY
jgi:hypothetical protein